jgi:hypothetical protein
MIFENPIKAIKVGAIITKVTEYTKKNLRETFLPPFKLNRLVGKS